MTRIDFVSNYLTALNSGGSKPPLEDRTRIVTLLTVARGKYLPLDILAQATGLLPSAVVSALKDIEDAGLVTLIRNDVGAVTSAQLKPIPSEK